MGRKSAGGCAMLDTLFSQMMAMKQTVLEDYAKSCGVDNKVLEQAIDAEEPKAELIKLILHQRPRDGLFSGHSELKQQPSRDEVTKEEPVQTPPEQQAAHVRAGDEVLPAPRGGLEIRRQVVKYETNQAVGSQPAPARALTQSRSSTPECEDEEAGGSCPFCQYTWGANGAGSGDDTDEQAHQFSAPVPAADPGVKTRKRRMVGPRRQNRKGRWWRRVGYDGPSYCQRCSECFRDHIIRSMSNSAGCTRSSPCNECSQILSHFPTDQHEMNGCWKKMDSKNKPPGRATRKAKDASVDPDLPPAQHLPATRSYGSQSPLQQSTLKPAASLQAASLSPGPGAASGYGRVSDPGGPQDRMPTGMPSMHCSAAAQYQLSYPLLQLQRLSMQMPLHQAHYHHRQQENQQQQHHHQQHHQQQWWLQQSAAAQKQHELEAYSLTKRARTSEEPSPFNQQLKSEAAMPGSLRAGSGPGRLYDPVGPTRDVPEDDQLSILLRIANGS